MRLRRAATTIAAVVLAACASTPTPTSPAPTVQDAATGATAIPTVAPSSAAAPAAYADTLRIGGLVASNRGWSWGDVYPAQSLGYGNLAYAALYRWNGIDEVVPDLADGPCQPQADPKVLRCRLKAATFQEGMTVQEGTPVTADDVAYEFRLLPSKVLLGYDNLVSTRVIDDTTVEFVLAKVDATFVTEGFAFIPIVPRRALEAAEAAFVTKTRGLKAADLEKLATAIGSEVDAKRCTTSRLDQVDALLARVDSRLYREDYLQRNGAFDPCAYLTAAVGVLGDGPAGLGFAGGIAWTLRQKGLDRTAGVLIWAARFLHLPGAGPYRYVTQDADHVRFEAWPGYHGGLAATRYVEILRTAQDGSDIKAGLVEIQPEAPGGAAYGATAAAHDVRMATPPSAMFYMLTFNVRPGRLFADIRLRRALQLCIDLPTDINAATGGAGTAIASPVLHGSWAADPTVRIPSRDPTTARMLIEASGWTPAADGVYAKDGIRLAAQVPVRADYPDRVLLVDMFAVQARECGIDLHSLPLPDDQYYAIITWPHVLPGTKTPFDILLWGAASSPDPASAMLIFTSSQATDANPEGWNLGGFKDASFDQLAAAGEATYDDVERGRIYRQAQRELAGQVPAIFLWAANANDAVRTTVSTTSGPLDLTLPNWAWQPERMIVARTGQ